METNELGTELILNCWPAGYVTWFVFSSSGPKHLKASHGRQLYGDEINRF